MTLREHISGVESVASLTGLGRLADRTALAVHQAETGVLSDDDRAALDKARALLEQLRSFAGMTVPPRVALQAMGPISVLEETFGAVSRTTPGRCRSVRRRTDRVDRLAPRDQEPSTRFTASQCSSTASARRPSVERRRWHGAVLMEVRAVVVHAVHLAVVDSPTAPGRQG